MTTTLTPSMRRSALISLLRDPSQWPKGFKWDYMKMDQCGIGLGEQTLALPSEDTDRCESLGLTEYQLDGVFHSGLTIFEWLIAPLHRWNPYRYPPARFVTPNMVADRLEAIHNQLAEVG